MIPAEYIIHKFYQYAGYPRHKKISNTYEGGCGICREGQSWGRKRRLYYIVKENIICCHNCGWYSSPADWIIEVTGMNWSQVREESEEYDYIPGLDTGTVLPNPVQSDLPVDSIDLFDTHQLRYHSSNQIVKKCLDVISLRRLDTAVNRPKSLYVSLTDKTHKNRLTIPFYDMNGKVSHYQSRRVLDDDSPKYLSKTNSEKSLFNVENLTAPDHIFIFEGPVDAFFVSNSVAVAGIQDTDSISLTSIQQNQLDGYILSKRVWVLDNDQTGRSKSDRLLRRGESVFVWPRELNHFKDINELCSRTKRDEISTEFILKNTFSGMKGHVKLRVA